MRLVLAIGKEEMSVKSMMEAVGLKNRPNFMDYSLTPAIREGFVCMKYPANPHHPRQRYLLTIKGLMLLVLLQVCNKKAVKKGRIST